MVRVRTDLKIAKGDRRMNYPRGLREYLKLLASPQDLGRGKTASFETEAPLVGI